ncbi:MAG: hypothetical protein GWN55_01505, partial [Phycisphaerae bacterium]|nr:hypothetical protein [Phycisphaerae bacterium]NIU08887.1 hypothetical protein [Phycisphaerae bacterium]NIV00008.1 hypothetical protein [Phycisphaerae bacterium]NIX32477.1 hypothetical protein [Phycisphaerae bacterium]
MRYVGSGLAESANRSRYNSQMALAAAQDLKDSNELETILHEHRNNPDLWDSDLDKWWKSHEKNMLTDITDPDAKSEINNNLLLQREQLKGALQKRKRIQERKNSNVAYDAMNLELQNTEFKDAYSLIKFASDYQDTTWKMQQTGDVDKINTPEMWAEQYDLNVSAAVTRYLLSNPHKTDEDGNIIEEDFWVNNPNKFAEEYSLNSAIG